MRPTDEQMKTALDAADRMWSRGVDPHHMARVLRYLHDRNALLEELLRRTDRLVRFGMPEQELKVLKKLVYKLREEDTREARDDSEINSSMLL